VTTAGVLARRLGPTAALLHAGRGEGWWWEGAPVGSDGTRRWTVRRASAAWEEIAPRRPRVLWDEPRTVLDEGFVYRCGRPVATVGPGEKAWSGPAGGLVIGAELAERGGPPGRSVRPLPSPLEPRSLRWSPDGARVAGRAPDGRAVAIDLRTMGCEILGDVEPVAPDAWIDSAGRLVRNGRTVLTGLVDASPAVWGDRLAGPGGLVWSLATGTPISRRRAIALGCTVGTPDGFVTVDWESHVLRTVPHDGRRGIAVRVPVDPEDTVVAGAWEDDALHLSTAAGERLRIVSGRIEPGDRDVPAALPLDLETPVGRWTMAGTTTCGDHRFAWTEDSWLVAWAAR